jgi:hypothetical protein
MPLASLAPRNDFMNIVVFSGVIASEAESRERSVAGSNLVGFQKNNGIATGPINRPCK